MTKQKHKKHRTPAPPALTLTYGKRTFRFIVDKVLIFRLMRKLHGRFWGLAGLLLMGLGFSVCFLIRPDLLQWSTAFSDFGRDVRTAPYFAAALFFGAYGLWRWRSYLRRTLKHARPLTALTGLTVIGLYTAALMPVAWEPLPYKIHLFGVALAGLATAATVVVDTLLTRVRKNKLYVAWRLLRFLSFILIVLGGYITLGSSNVLNWYALSLVGETMMVLGYTLWIIDKTYRGEGSRSELSKLLKKIVLID